MPAVLARALAALVVIGIAVSILAGQTPARATFFGKTKKERQRNGFLFVVGAAVVALLAYAISTTTY